MLAQKGPPYDIHCQEDFLGLIQVIDSDQEYHTHNIQPNNDKGADLLLTQAMSRTLGNQRRLHFGGKDPKQRSSGRVEFDESRSLQFLSFFTASSRQRNQPCKDTRIRTVLSFVSGVLSFNPYPSKLGSRKHAKLQ